MHKQALVEILLLSGGTPYANFKDLAYGWGREKGSPRVCVNVGEKSNANAGAMRGKSCRMNNGKPFDKRSNGRGARH